MITLSLILTTIIICYQSHRIAKITAQRDEAMRIAEEAIQLVTPKSLPDQNKYSVAIYNDHDSEITSSAELAHAVITYGHQNKELN